MSTTVVLLTVCYLFPIAVGVGMDQQWSLWKEGYLPVIATHIGGPWLGTWLMAAGMLSAVGLFTSLLCTSARIPYALSVQRMLPAAFAQMHPRYGTPWVGILVNSFAAVALITFSFQELIELDMFLYALALVLEFAAFCWLRYKEPQLHRPYRVPGGRFGVIALSAPPVALCLFSMSLAETATKLVGLGGVVLGLMIFFLQAFFLRKNTEQVKEVAAL
jgi:amino acid transporter